MFRYVLPFLCCAAGASADVTVLSNAKIWTVHPDQPWATAIAIDGTRIVAVGDLDDMPVADHVIDLDGQMVLPGFQDIHVHAVEAGMNEIMCLFDAFDDLDGHIAHVQDCAEHGNTGRWVLGSNVNMTNLLDHHENPIAVLDKLVPDRPVLILDDIGHGAWVNSVALREVGFENGSDAAGNIVLMTPQGTPNGVVLENAPQAFRTAAFMPNDDTLALAYDSLIAASKTLNANGITTVSDAGGYWPQGHHKVWKWAETDGALTVRASNTLYVYPDLPWAEQLRTLTQLRDPAPDGLVRFTTAKIYVDGILGQATGALTRPYAAGLGLDHDTAYGYQYFGQDNLTKISQDLTTAGFQLNFHSVGDLAARQALNAIEATNGVNGPHRLTHVYMVDPTDIPRFAELGVIADLQLAPSAISFAYKSQLNGYIGNRTERLMPAGELIDAGATVTLSSDWDADELNPLIKISQSVARRTNGLPSVEAAIQSLTILPAQALNHADTTGSLRAGKLADLVILSDNILDMSVADIAQTKITATMFNGTVVFDPTGIFNAP